MGWEVLIRGEWVVSVEGVVLAAVPRKESMKACGKMLRHCRQMDTGYKRGWCENCRTFIVTGSQAWGE